METLQMLYYGFSIVGALFLLLSIFGGGDDLELDVGEPDFDISDAEVGVEGPGIFSMKTISVFLLGFGIAGTVAFHIEASVVWQLISGFATGIIIGGLFLLAMRGMYSMQGDSSTSAESFVGKQAIVIVPTTESGICQVRIGNSQEFIAKELSGSKLKQNETCTIKQYSAGVFMVEKDN